MTHTTRPYYTLNFSKDQLLEPIIPAAISDNRNNYYITDSNYNKLIINNNNKQFCDNKTAGTDLCRTLYINLIGNI